MPTSPSVFTLSMRLISAFASSFLFVPIVLADDLVPWAGAFLLNSNEGSYSFATGTFNTPLAWGDNNLGVSIMVGIAGIAGVCTSNIAFMAGIDVLLTNNVVSYSGGAKWGTQLKWPQKFDIHTGDIIRASVTVYSATTGSALLENLSTGDTWREYFSADESVVCQGSAEWGVTALEGYPTNGMPVPKLSTVTIVNATTKTASGASVTSGSAGAMINMSYNDTMLTSGMAAEDVVVVASEMY
ncbi:peptidase G1 [Boletus edulis BED1]|uniref:Peptidase G1 n=1 Tax=Boletus edulis BED1 TaxID=1328754 RepID=A0AAD4BTM0_BOLED|nr:peptidase G1 [Boletus edulis BED1]